MGNLKRVNKIMAITLIVFSLGVFANYSKTSSKYFVDDLDSKEDNIVNLISFKSLKYDESTKGLISYKELLTNLEISDIEYNVKFFRKVVGENDTDVVTDNYKFVVDKGCTIKSVTTPKAPTYTPNPDGSINDSSKGVMTAISSEKDSKTDNVVDITYVNDVKSNTSAGSASSELITVTYTCPLDVVKRDKDGGGEETSTVFNIYEKINDESEFLYLNYTFTNDFVQKVYNVLINGSKLEKMHVPVEDSMIDFDEEFDKWIQAYGTEFAKNNSKYPTIAAIIKDYVAAKDVKNKANQGLGLKSGASDAGSAYKIMYQFDTIASQAVTYNSYVQAPSDSPKLYFIDSMSQAEATAIFKSYLKDYYKYSDAEINTIVNYVNEYDGGIQSVLSGTTIPGISVSITKEYIMIDSTILRQIENRSRVIVSKKNINDNIMNDFTDNLTARNNTYKWLTGNLTIPLLHLRSCESLKESLLSTNSNLNDYYFYRNGNAVVVFRVYNNDYDPDNAYVEVTRFAMNASNPGSETLDITNPTRLLYIGALTATNIDAEKSYIDYTSAVIAAKTGVSVSDYTNVVADAKTWLSTDPHENNSTVVEFSKIILFGISYSKNPKLIQIDRVPYAAQASEPTV